MLRKCIYFVPMHLFGALIKKKNTQNFISPATFMRLKLYFCSLDNQNTNNLIDNL